MEIQWRIYYADKSTFDNTMGEPWEAPGTRVLIILQQHKDPSERAYFQWRTDFYRWWKDRWIACDYFAIMQYWFCDQLHIGHPRASLAGETVDNDLWDDVERAARADKDFFK